MIPVGTVYFTWDMVDQVSLVAACTEIQGSIVVSCTRGSGGPGFSGTFLYMGHGGPGLSELPLHGTWSKISGNDLYMGHSALRLISCFLYMGHWWTRVQKFLLCINYLYMGHSGPELTCTCLYIGHRIFYVMLSFFLFSLYEKINQRHVM